MNKICIEIATDDMSGMPVEGSFLLEMAEAAVATIRGLGGLGEAINTVRVTFADFELPYKQGGITQNEPGPIFTIIFSDSQGKMEWYKSDYRLIGKGTKRPSKDEVVKHFCGNPRLGNYIFEHLEHGRENHDGEQKRMAIEKER